MQFSTFFFVEVIKIIFNKEIQVKYSTVTEAVAEMVASHVGKTTLAFLVKIIVQVPYKIPRK
jgi:hypothetical protein